VEAMTRRLTIAARRKLNDATRQRYRAGSARGERRYTIAEFVWVTGSHDKHALRVS